MTITHKVFLYWLLYLTIVGFAIVVSIMIGLPQLAMAHDKSYLSMSLVALYAVAELLAGKQAIMVSRLHRTVTDAATWLNANEINSIIPIADGSVVMGSGSDSFTIAKGPLADLVVSVSKKSANGPHGKVDQGALVDAFIENLERNTGIGEFLAARIVWLGILATIVGVIMAFWPFQAAGMTIDTMRANLGGFFSGVAVAFIPTAVSFIFKISLDFNSKILHDGVSEIIENVTRMVSSQIVPRLENGSISV